MPHHHHVDMVMRHNHAHPQVAPSEPTPFPLPTPTSLDADLPALVPRAEATCAGHSCEKSTSNLETTVLPVVLGAGYV